jgi:glycosyltransferase involved in cell wall biosynthesis
MAALLRGSCKKQTRLEIMRILVAVHDLIVEKSHLMPWRTVCEVVKHMRKDGHDAHLISLGIRDTELQGRLIPEGTKEIRKSSGTLVTDLIKELERTRPDIIFWPVAWRESIQRIKVATDTNVPIVLWFPGGVYSLGACFHSLKRLGFGNTLPYLREALSNRGRQVANFNKYGVRAILAMTKTTADSAVTAGWHDAKSFVIPPGKGNALQKNKLAALPVDFKEWLDYKPFYLFMGPPSGIRGIFELLEAFDLAADKNKEIRLVCLFRSDGTLDSQKVKKKIEKCYNRTRIYSVWRSLSSEELNCFMAACHAVTMPFVMVPSEIPLAIIEAMAWGNPIITTSPGGTGDFVEEFGLSPKVGDIAALADALVKMHTDEKLYQRKCQNCVQAYDAHPDWRSVSQMWVNVAENSLN